MENDRLEPAAREDEHRALPEQDRHLQGEAGGGHPPREVHRLVREPAERLRKHVVLCVLRYSFAQLVWDRWLTGVAGVVDLKRKFAQIHKERSPEPRMFYCHFTTVTVSDCLSCSAPPCFQPYVGLQDTKSTQHILADGKLSSAFRSPFVDRRSSPRHRRCTKPKRQQPHLMTPVTLPIDILCSGLCFACLMFCLWIARCCILALGSCSCTPLNYS